MNHLNDQTIERLVGIEAQVHYGEPPPPDVPPFVSHVRPSPILISAPHGTRTFRNNDREIWHEEDEYTAAMALLLSERCGTSVIANIWRSDMCDPNWHLENQCHYKHQMRKLVSEQNIRWVLDLHGAAETSLGSPTKLVDLGTRKDQHSLDIQHRDQLRELVEARLGANCVSLDQFSASIPGTITAFCQTELKIQAVQIEMKPSVRIPFRRADASAYSKSGPYSVPGKNILAMLSALEVFTTYLRKV